MLSPVINATFVMVLLTAVSWIMRVTYHLFMPQFGHNLRCKLHGEQIEIFFIFILEFDLEQAGVTLEP